MNRIGIIGDADSVIGFKAFGLDAFACRTGSEASEVLHKIIKEDYGIIFITEGLYSEIEDDIDKYEDLMIPAIVSIPGREGSHGTGLSKIKKAVEKAVGVDILFSDK